MKITETILLEKSTLKNDGVHYDYVDSFVGEYSDKKQNSTSTQIGQAFFISAPSWVESLLTFRNNIVRVFGLKTLRGSNYYNSLLNPS